MIMDEQISTGAELAPEVNAVTQEKMLSQSEVNAIVGRVKQEERAKAQAEKQYGQIQPVQQQAQVGEQDIRRLASEEAHRLRNEWVSEAQTKAETDHAQRIVKNFWEKVNSGKEKYQDFDTVTGNIALQKFPNMVQLLADHVDNSSDVLYEFGKNRLKLAQLEQLSYMSPDDAIVEIKRLSQSIKDNEKSGNQRVANAPLSQQRPSNTGTEAGAMSVADYRKKYKV